MPTRRYVTEQQHDRYVKKILPKPNHHCTAPLERESCSLGGRGTLRSIAFAQRLWASRSASPASQGAPIVSGGVGDRLAIARCGNDRGDGGDGGGGHGPADDEEKTSDAEGEGEH